MREREREREREKVNEKERATEKMGRVVCAPQVAISPRTSNCCRFKLTKEENH